MKQEFNWRDYDRFSKWLHEVLETQQEEIERLNENNQSMQEEMVRTWKKLDEKENIINEAIEYIVHPTFKGTHSTNEEVLVDILRILKGE